jgi:hypothetical protein
MSACRQNPIVAERTPLRAAVAVLMMSGVAVATAAPDEPDCAPQQRLEESQSCRLRVDATRVEVTLPLRLASGDRYRVTLAAGSHWNDWGRKPVDPLQGDAGTDSFWMSLFKPLKRMPAEPYMVPGMAIADCDAFNRVCLRTEARLAAEGLLLAVNGPTVSVAFFANDAPLLNWNNGGAVWVRVRRLPATAADVSWRT